jgi:hypothetical protein
MRVVWCLAATWALTGACLHATLIIKTLQGSPPCTNPANRKDAPNWQSIAGAGWKGGSATRPFPARIMADVVVRVQRARNTAHWSQVSALLPRKLDGFGSRSSPMLLARFEAVLFGSCTASSVGISSDAASASRYRVSGVGGTWEMRNAASTPARARKRIASAIQDCCEALCQDPLNMVRMKFGFQPLATLCI